MSGSVSVHGPWRQAVRAIGGRFGAWLCAVLWAGAGLAVALLTAIALRELRPLIERSSVAPVATATLSAGATGAEEDAARRAVLQIPAVADARLVTRDEALAQIAARAPADRDAIGQLGGNPLADALVVKFKSQSGPEQIEAAAAAIGKTSRIEGVAIDLGWYRKLWTLGRDGLAVAAGALVLIVLQGVAALLVAVSLGGPLQERRIRLLWQLGADDRAIRAEPVAAAVLSSAAVSLVAILVARAGWHWLGQAFDSIGRLYGHPVAIGWADPAWLAAFAGSILTVGAVAGSLVARLRLAALRRSGKSM